MKQPILTRSSPILMHHHPCRCIQMGGTRELTAEQRFVYDGRVLTRFLHALCSEGVYIRASCGASRHWGKSEGRYILARVYNGRVPTEMWGATNFRRREGLYWEGGGVVVTTGVLLSWSRVCGLERRRMEGDP